VSEPHLLKYLTTAASFDKLQAGNAVPIGEPDAFQRDEVTAIKKVVFSAMEALPITAKQPLQKQVAWHQIPREVRRATYAETTQAVLTKDYAQGGVELAL
jgi:hypothetical protein